ncbi:MAG: ATP-binding protein [Planctomycetota bacterium]
MSRRADDDLREPGWPGLPGASPSSGALLDEHELNRRLLETVPVIVLVLDTERRIVYFNPHMERLSGWRLDEMRGRDWFKAFLPERDRARIGTLFGQAIDGFRVSGSRNPIVLRDGTERMIEWQGTMLQDAHGCTVGLLSAGTDVTERDAMEERRRQSQKMEAVGRLATGIAHDFNNLLMGIGGCAEMAVRGLAESSSAHARMEEIREAAASGASVVRQLMSFSRDDPRAPAGVEVDALLAAREGLLRRLLGEEIQLDLEVDAPGLGVGLAAGAVEQVLMNLVVNAREAMPRGGRLAVTTQRVDLDAGTASHLPGLAPGRHLVLEVADDGLGMDEETRSRAFEPFFSTKGERGTGLGLSTVYGIVRRGGGHVDIESAPGLGTRFRIYLPAVATNADSAAPAEAAPRRRAGPATVLVLEDDTLVRRTACFYLERLGHRALATADADEAFQVVRERAHEIELLLTDVMVPGEHAAEDVARELRARSPGTPVVYMSAYSREDLLRQGRILPGARALTKPFGRGELRDVIGDILGAGPEPA